jgi:pre-60S factor REI1
MFNGKEIGGEPEEMDADMRAAAMQKEHYKTDWHRYNLKRKVAELPPVTAENFQERIIAHKNQMAEGSKSTSCHCVECDKRFNTTNAFTNHLQSKKHKDQLAAIVAGLVVKKSSAAKRAGNTARDMRAENDETNAQLKKATLGSTGVVRDGTARSKTNRLVEAIMSGVSLDNAAADDDNDGEWEDVDDEENGGAEEDMADEEEAWKLNAIAVDHCLFCPEVSKDMEANIRHMTIAHSFFIPDLEYVVDLEGLLAYLGEKVGVMRMCLWCNEKSRVFPELRAVQQHMTDKGHCKLFHEGDAVLEYADFYDYRPSYPDYKPGEAGEAMEDEDMEATPASIELQEQGYLMVLPSGDTVGHRTLQRYYRQKLRPGRELVVSANSSSISKVMSQYKALGWIDTTGAAAQRKAKDIAYVNRMKARFSVNVGVKANKFQKHFRDDNFGTH